MLHISLNGPDLVGKTTQLKALSKSIKCSKVIRSVRHYIEGMPRKDRDIDAFFKNLSSDERFRRVLGGYLKRYQEIKSINMDRVIIDRGRLNLYSDLMACYYPEYSISEAFKLANDSIMALFPVTQELVIYLKIDLSIYLHRLRNKDGFTNIEFQSKLNDIFNYLESRIEVVTVDGNQSKSRVMGEILALVSEFNHLRA